jgi:hypothetical protein
MCVEMKGLRGKYGCNNVADDDAAQQGTAKQSPARQCTSSFKLGEIRQAIENLSNKSGGTMRKTTEVSLCRVTSCTGLGNASRRVDIS